MGLYQKQIMQEKGRFLKKVSCLLFLLIVFLSKNILANDIKLKLSSYNQSLKNSSLLFIQTDGQTIEEGIIYIGKERIKVIYQSPNKITIVISQKKGMYVNHELEEVQYFNTNKSFVSVFFNILTGPNYSKNTEIQYSSDSILLKDNFSAKDKNFNIEVFYENNPIKLRKIKVKEGVDGFEIGFFDHQISHDHKDGFFSLINPLIN